MTVLTKAQIKAEITASTAGGLLGGTILTNIVDSYYDASTSPLIAAGAIGVGTSNPGNQVPTVLSPGAQCVDVQFTGGGGPFSLVMNGPQGTFYAMGSNAGYAWFQNLGSSSSGPAYAMALNNDTTLNLFYSNNSFTIGLTNFVFTATPGSKFRIFASGEFAQATSNTALATYFQGPYVYVQTTDPNFTAGNTCTYDFRDGHGHSFAAIIGQVISQPANNPTGLLAIAVSNASNVASVSTIFWASGGVYIGTVAGDFDPGAGSLGVSNNAGIGKNALTTSFLALAAGTTAKSQINLAASTAPTSPNDGDFWYDGANVKIRVGASTKTFTLS